MGPLTQTVKSIVSETHIYSKQWDKPVLHKL